MGCHTVVFSETTSPRMSIFTLRHLLSFRCKIVQIMYRYMQKYWWVVKFHSFCWQHLSVKLIFNYTCMQWSLSYPNVFVCTCMLLSMIIFENIELNSHQTILYCVPMKEIQLLLQGKFFKFSQTRRWDGYISFLTSWKHFSQLSFQNKLQG